jgi:hypothetical protein
LALRVETPHFTLAGRGSLERPERSGGGLRDYNREEGI